MNLLDSLLNKITTYRLVLYGLIAMTIYAFVASFAGKLSYTPLDLFLLLTTLLFTCFFGNILLSKIFRAVINVESSLITAFILFFLLFPSHEIGDVLVFLFAGSFAMLSKYILAYKRKHIFNPAAIAAVSLILFNTGAIWWVATGIMLPVTLLVGLLIVRKIRRFTMFLTFIAVTLSSFLVQVQLRELNLLTETIQFFTSFPVIFFGTVMLTEPLTLPPTRRLQVIYASLVGFLFSWQGGFGSLILTTELVLVFGNVFSFVFSPKYRLYLTLIKKEKIATNTFEFTFKKPKSFNFRPGQYLEWTIPISITDSRGNRRYFTVASSPTEDVIRLAVRFNTPSSIYKKYLSRLSDKTTIVASQLVGDFTLPDDAGKKLVFIAGGIGITPFRCMLKFLLDKNERRDITLFYSNKVSSEIAYGDLFDEVRDKLGIKVVYILTETENLPIAWKGEKGRINTNMLQKHVKNIDERRFFISGPNSMVESYKVLLKKMKVKPTEIVTDYFPGF